ncbi:MAG: transglycosylase SLT domain-containing protein [Ardenticatenales bacterium]
MTAQSVPHPLAAESPFGSAFGAIVSHLKFVGFVAACLALSVGARAMQADRSPSAVLGSSAVFFPQANGTVRDRTVLADAPAGAPLRWLGIGERVAVGGTMAGHAGDDVYWVEIVTPAGAKAYGFLPVEAVIVTAGRVPSLRYEAAPSAEWLAPAQPSSAAPASDLAIGVMAANSAAAANGAAAASALGATAPVAIPWLPESVGALRERIAAVANAANVDPDLVAILVLVESGGNPSASSPAGATGLMQLMPGTARDMAAQTGRTDYEPSALSDIDTNLSLGAAYVAAMLKAFGQRDDPDWQRSVELAAAAYNGGPGHVGQHLTTGQPLFAETASYQRWVGGMWRERHDADSPTYRAWLAAGGQRLVEAATDRLAMASTITP